LNPAFPPQPGIVLIAGLGMAVLLIFAIYTRILRKSVT